MIRLIEEKRNNLHPEAQGSFQKVLKQNKSGFIKAVEDTEVWESSQKHGVSLRSNFKKLALFGIGGSSLGPKVIQQFLMDQSDRSLIIFENVDPISFEMKFKELGPLSDVHFIFISKSGKTLETLAQLSMIVERLEGFSLTKHVTVVSDPVENPLTQWATTNKVKVFSIPLDVGGRFSVMTPVGLIPLSFLTGSVSEMRLGAQEAIKNGELVEALVSLTLNSYKRGEWITVFWGYSDLLQSFGDWIQQLWAESLAKKNNFLGDKAPRVSTPLSLVGANDQHSILQQIMEGDRDKWVIFLGIESLEKSGAAINKVIGLPAYIQGKSLGNIISAERTATQKALSQNQISNSTLLFQNNSPRALGFAFQLLELWVGALAESLQINAYDQPGVELGKKIAFDILAGKLS